MAEGSASRLSTESREAPSTRNRSSDPGGGDLRPDEAKTKQLKELKRLKEEVAKTEAKLANPDFRANAPPEIVQKLEDRAAELRAAIDRLR